MIIPFSNYRRMQGLGMGAMWLFGKIRQGGWLLFVPFAVLALAWGWVKTETHIVEITPTGTFTYRFEVEKAGETWSATCDAFFCRFLEVGDCVVVDRIWDVGRDKCDPR